MKKQKSKVLVSERIVGSSMPAKTDPLSMRKKAGIKKSMTGGGVLRKTSIPTKNATTKEWGKRKVNLVKSQGSKKTKNRKRNKQGGMQKGGDIVPTWRPFMM